MADLHRDNGVDVRLGVGIEADLSPATTERCDAVELADGSVIDASVVVVGIGADPLVDWLEGSGLDLRAAVRGWRGAVRLDHARRPRHRGRR